MVAAADVVLQNVRVLAVDQIADERTEKPSIAKAVTLEVEVMAAQKLALAATVGTLSLALRKAGEVDPFQYAPHHGQRSTQEHRDRQPFLHGLRHPRRAEDSNTRYQTKETRSRGLASATAQINGTLWGLRRR